MNKLLLGLVLVSTSAFCEPIAYTMNEGGGKIVITNEQCNGSTYKLAYATHPNTNTQFGCWYSDQIGIHINWNTSGLRSYDYSGWSMVNKKANL